MFKKIVLMPLITLLLALPVLASEHPLTKLNQQAQKLLGFNPQAQATEDLCSKQTRKKTALLCLPGLGCKQGKDYTTYFPGNKNYCTVTLNFEHTGKKNISPSALNPDKDTQLGLLTLMHLHKKGYKTTLFGHSYGGGIGIKILDALNHQNDYKKMWEALGYTKFKIICSCGIIPIDFNFIPDTSSITLLKKSIIGAYFEKPILASSFRTSMQENIYGQPARCEMDPIELLSDLKSHIPLSFVLAQKDDVLGNDSDKQLKKIARYENWTVETINEDHNDITQTPKWLKQDLEHK